MLIQMKIIHLYEYFYWYPFFSHHLNHLNDCQSKSCNYGQISYTNSIILKINTHED